MFWNKLGHIANKMRKIRKMLNYIVLVACCSRSHILYKVLNAQFVNVGVLGEVEVQSGSLLSLTLLLGYIQPRPQQLCGPVSNVWMVAGGWNALMSWTMQQSLLKALTWASPFIEAVQHMFPCWDLRHIKVTFQTEKAKTFLTISTYLQSTYFLVYVSWFRNRSAPSSRV